MPDARRLPLHHLELAVSFEQPSCLLLSGWTIRPEELAELEVVSTASALDALALTSCRWHRREDVEQELGASGPATGFCALVETTPEQLDGPLHLAFRMKNGTRLLGSPIEPTGYRADMLTHLQGVFADNRGLVSPALVAGKPRPAELLRVMAAPPREFSETAAIWVEHAVSLPGGSTFVSGWCYAEHGFESLEVLDAQGHCLSDVLAAGVFFSRLDVSACVQGRPGAARDLGFAVTIDAPRSREAQGEPWFLCGVTAEGKLYGLDLPATPTETVTEAAQRLISAVPPKVHRESELIERCLGPALFSLKHSPRAPELGFREWRYGKPAEHAEVAIVVAAEDGPDWLRYQLASFADEHELAVCDLLYVVNDPSAAEALVQTAEDIHAHFGVSFRLLAATETLPPSTVINAAVRANGCEYVLLLDGRVLPRTRSFVSALRSAYTKAGDACGAGPKLVTEKGTIAQPLSAPGHNGDSGAGVGPRGGLPDALTDVRGPTPVTSLSTACLLTRRALFVEAGGAVEDYWQARFADFDLCARLKRSGGQLYYAPEIVMDHLGACPHRPQELGFGEERLDHYDRWLLNRRLTQNGHS